MVADLLSGTRGVTCGTMTTGGTESICMAVKTCRDKVREDKGITEPEMIMSQTVHPAFEKAAHYFGVKTIHVGVDADGRADAAAMKAAVTKNTMMIVVSAPQYPHGVIDPVEDISEFGLAKDIWVHVDACVGGLFLPFLRMIGHPLPKFDFALPGVCSMSADIHKYGYAIKGASVVLYKNAEYRKHQFFAYGKWPGGLFVSPSMLGTRGGGSIAAAWAALVGMGKDGYCKLVKGVMETSKYIQDNLAMIEPLEIIGKPDMSIVAFRSTDKAVNIFAVGDVLENQFGWRIERQQLPNSIHCSLMPSHGAVRETFIKDLKAAIEIARNDPELLKKDSAAMYGMVASIPDGTLIDQFLVQFMSKVYNKKA